LHSRSCRNLSCCFVSALAFNAFWPQNYITDPAQGTLTLDQMVVATQRIGCIR